MRFRGTAAIAAVLAVLASFALATPAPAQLGDNEVRVKNNFFDPFEIRVERAGTVTWVVDAGGHSITADDGRFDFDQPPSGSTRQHTFGDVDEVVGYYCRYHGAPGAGMHGYVLVGDATRPTPSPTPEPTPPPERIVPSDYPSISAALSGAAPGTVISIAPGTYPEGRLRVRGAGIVVRGTGTAPSDVVVDATQFTTGFDVSAPNVRIENLAVRGARSTGIAVVAVEGFAIEHVELADNGVFGVSVERGARSGSIRDALATGSGEAGFSVRGCTDCDTVVERVTASGNAYGFEAVNAGGVVVRDSTFTVNRTGVLVATLPTEDAAPQRGVHVYRNTIADNDGADVAPAGRTETLDAPDGVGVWVAGGTYVTVERNTVTGHDRYGVVLSLLLAPTFADRVLDNVVGGSGTADLAWDGLGLGVCFEGNRTPAGEEPTGVPEGAQGLYPCDGLPRPGVPQPQLTAELILASAS